MERVNMVKRHAYHYLPYSNQNQGRSGRTMSLSLQHWDWHLKFIYILHIHFVHLDMFTTLGLASEVHLYITYRFCTFVHVYQIRGGDLKFTYKLHIDFVHLYMFIKSGVEFEGHADTGISFCTFAHVYNITTGV